MQLVIPLKQKDTRSEQQVLLDAADEMFDQARATFKNNLPDGPELYAKLRDVASLRAQTIKLIEELWSKS